MFMCFVTEGLLYLMLRQFVKSAGDTDEPLDDCLCPAVVPVNFDIWIPILIFGLGDRASEFFALVGSFLFGTSLLTLLVALL